MSGIYIPGIDMPDSCDNCFVCNRCEGNCDISDADYLPNKRPDDCPLIELPPHGRLGDLDAFAAKMKERQIEAGKWLRDAKDNDTAVRADAVLSFLCEVKLTLDKTPTIIPAEGGADG